ncbi:MAG: precorrin-6y C5,15-methyltransferase (decarboxylating) subunit CbiE [Oscillospiraceae bacterium]|nr:precorrin-6y C5,15-methyltransferase (decarboxylating) subunit CbiE [Oscillospiraceae bacterium]
MADATHPYADVVTANISRACAALGIERVRLDRGASAVSESAVTVPDTEAAASFLDAAEGNILLATGSKELGKFASIRDFAERVYARVLPLDTSLEACRAAGLPPSHIIAMQGPFSEDLNEAMLRFTAARFLVTKDGGDKGGFAEKAAAAERTGARLVVIGRPAGGEGLSLAGAIALLCERFGCRKTPEVSVVGIGPGSEGAMTREAARAIAGADCLIGAKRMTEAAAKSGQAVCHAIAPDDIAGCIKAHGEYGRFAVLMSGDTGFFSGTKKLLPALHGCRVTVLPGLSSLSYLCARLGKSWEDVLCVSLHGREHDIVPDVRRHKRVFALVGGENGMHDLCAALSRAGLENVRVSVGERLSYPDERVVTGTAQTLLKETFAPLSVALIENDAPDLPVTPGLPDDAFERGEGKEGVVPMTKSEVRAVCLSKLRLTADSVCWDIGAGTGSVSVEMALLAHEGHVWAIERREEAVELLRRNIERFSLENVTAAEGSAPEACRELPAPTHAFIGGTAGKLREIVSLLLEKNPNVRIVATAVSLESAAEITACMREFGFAETETVTLNVSRSRKAGRYHLMTALNPVTIFTMQAGGKA